MLERCAGRLGAGTDARPTGVNLATLETASVAGAGTASGYFNAPDTDSNVTVSAVFY